MTPYSPFLIAPFQTGLDLDVQPWLQPQDAFGSIINGHIHNGVTEKREGYEKLGHLVHKNGVDWNITGIVVGAGVVTVSLNDNTGLTTGDVVEFRDVTGMTELNGNRYTITVVIAGVGGTFTLDNVIGTLFTAWAAGGGVYLVPEDRVMGIERYITSGNTKTMLAFDTKRAATFNTSSKRFDPIDTADIMSGADTDYIWAANWASTASTAASTLYRLYFTNGKALAGGLDGIRYFDGGTTTTSFAPVINGVTTINGAKLLFAYRERLLLLATQEGGTLYPQRLRWCQAQNPSAANAWDDNVAGRGGFVDAPTGDHIISARFVQDGIIVFFTDSVWQLRPTSDPALPFRWDKINNFRACDGKMTSEQYDRVVIAVGGRGITTTDGTDTRRIDDKIKEFVAQNINQGQFGKVFTRRSFSTRRTWLLYPYKESDEADESLIYAEESGAFSIYEVGMNVLGYGGAASDPTIADFDDKTIADFGDDTILDYAFDEGSEIFLGGDRSGVVYVMEQGGDDAEILFSATILDVTPANPAVVTMTADIGLSDGDIVTISGIAVGSMVELNDRSFFVTSKSGNTFALLGENSVAYAAYVAGSGGDVRSITASDIELKLLSAGWNPFIKEGRRAQLGYVDLFVDSHETAAMDIDFLIDNDPSPYLTSQINLLPPLGELASVADVSRANPAVVLTDANALNEDTPIYIYGVTGMGEINGGPYTFTIVNNFSISLDDVDSTNFGEYLNGGVITILPFRSTKAWKRVYCGGTGYQHRMKIRSKGRDRDVRIHAFMPWFRPIGKRTI